jgi:succinate-semialdehyde dehydrogenase/glutarate-semialdehyde dehydrogenase
MITRKAGPALAAGCTDGLQTGVGNAAVGLGAGRTGRARGRARGRVQRRHRRPRDIGGELTANPVVRKLTFTGSTEIGKVLMRSAPAR